MNSMRRAVAPFLVLATALILILAVAPVAGATPISEKQARAREIAAKLEALYPKVSLAVERYNQAMESLTTVKQKIKENEHLLKIAEYNLGLARRQLETRAVSMYKTRDVGFVDVLFATNSFDELVTQLDLMERLGQSDVDTVKSIAAYKRDVKDRRLKLDADKKAAVDLLAEATAEKNKVQTLEAKLERMERGVKAEIRRLRAPGRRRRAGRRPAILGRRVGAGRRPRRAGPPRDRRPRPARARRPLRLRHRQAQARSTARGSRCTATRRSASACPTPRPHSSR